MTGMDSERWRARARFLSESAQRRPPPGNDDETPEQVREAVRGILSAAAPPPPPDPLTGRVPTKRRLPSMDNAGELTARQLHRRIMEIAREAGLA